ncbi:MAG: DUF6356 family protein [Gammaproteobacteria bacterium]
MRQLFTAHPASVNETYFEHMAVALGFFARFVLGATVLLVHAFLPFLFCRSGSRIINDLHQRMIHQRRRNPPEHAAGLGTPGQ